MTEVSREKIRENGYPNPIPLSEKLWGSLTWRQGEILTSLVSLAEEEQGLINEINALAPTPSGVLRTGSALTVCEDEDDWMVITMRQRENLRKVKDKIKTLLNEALDCGIGYLGIIQRQCTNYEVAP